MSTVTDTAAPAAWLTTPLGRYVLESELKYVEETVSDVFGFNALQLGLVEYDFLSASRIPLRCRVGAAAPADVVARFRDLPIETNSIDLLVLPHVLEFSVNPHQILREIHRVLMPDGHAVITCFNPRSLWGVRRLFSRSDVYPWEGHFITLPRMKDWLALLELEIVAGRMGCYVPPFSQERWIQRFQFLEAAGDRWWPIAGGVYFLHVIKRVRGMRVIMPNWRHKVVRPNLAVVPKTQDNDEPAAARDLTNPR